MKRSSSCSFIILFLMSFAILLSAQVGWSQEKDDKKAALMPLLGLHMGTLLPNQIDGVTEMIPMWGARFGFPRKTSLIELGAMHANAIGTSYTNASISLRGNIPLESLYGIVYGGADFHYYKGPTDLGYRMIGGGHLGGGLGVEISQYLHFRGEMKFNVNPGTSLYIGFGFEMLFPQEKEKGDEAK